MLCSAKYRDFNMERLSADNNPLCWWFPRLFWGHGPRRWIIPQVISDCYWTPANVCPSLLTRLPTPEAKRTHEMLWRHGSTGFDLRKISASIVNAWISSSEDDIIAQRCSFKSSGDSVKTQIQSINSDVSLENKTQLGRLSSSNKCIEISK